MTDLSDDRLLRAYCNGDRTAFDALYRRYAARVHATAYRLTGNWEDAEDTLQEVFLSLARQGAKIRRARALSSWIYRTTINRSIDCLRRRRAAFSLDAPGAHAAGVIAMESVRRDAERERARSQERLLLQVEGLIPKLPPRQKAVFVLRFFQGLSHREIASIIGCSEAGSKSHHSLACRKLRAWVAQSTRDEEKNTQDAEMPHEG